MTKEFHTMSEYLNFYSKKKKPKAKGNKYYLLGIKVAEIAIEKANKKKNIRKENR